MRIGNILKSLVCTFSLVLVSTLPAAADDSDTIHVFQLEHAKAEAVSDLIDQLADGNIKIATDARSNSVVMIGDEQQANVIEALLAKLDKEVEHSHNDEHREHEIQEQAELRVLQMMEEREHRRHAENLGNEIRHLEMKMEMMKAELKHQSAMMELELETAKLKAEKANLSVKLTEELVADGKASESDVAAARLEAKAHILEAKKTALELEHFKKRAAPMQMRKLEFELGNRHREMETFGGHERNRHKSREQERVERRREEERELKEGVERAAERR